MKTNQIICGDCLDIMKDMDDNSVDLVLTDPPYYRVVQVTWDRAWKTVQVFIDWMESVAVEIKRVLKSNGSFYCFCDDWMSGYLQVMLDKHFVFLNHIVWYKTNNQSIKAVNNLRSFAPMTERVLFYTNENSRTGLQSIHDDKDCFAKIKEYMRGERSKLMQAKGMSTIEKFNAYIRKVTKKSTGSHYFGDSQYAFPTKEMYEKLQSTGFWSREYEDLRREYEDLRRVYNPQKGVTDVISEPIVSISENTAHPTTKPIRIIKPLMLASSNPNDLILDPFCGSGTTCVAAKLLGRNYIGIDMSEEYCQIARERINAVETGVPVAEQKSGQAGLFS